MRAVRDPLDGIVWLVLIFACVVVHELAHCVVARRRGAIVREIVLLPIGGVSRLENLPETPGDEFAIAVAGPAASLGLAFAAAVLAASVRQPLWPVDLANGPWLARLAWFNLIVGAFNLLPAFPLDGGRVLRALLEQHLDLEQATRRAARIGRSLAVALAVVGFLFDFWLLVIGIFVYFGATAEEAATIVHLRLGTRTAADVMLRDPMVVRPELPVAELAALPQQTAQRVFPVVGDGGYVGLVRLGLPTVGARNAAEAADRAVPLVAPGDSLEAVALPLVVRSKARAVAVADRDRVVGLICVEDVEHLLEP